jgi:heterotetrameric sarcosine oxidase gamma subunit
VASANDVAGAEVTAPPLARSSIAPKAPVLTRAGWEVSGCRSDGPLRLADLTPLSKVLVRADVGSPAERRLDCGFGRTRRHDPDSLVIGAGPDEWFIWSPAGTRSELAAEIESDRGDDAKLLSVIDVTHGSVVLRLSGANAHRVLEKLCAIDLSDGVTPNESCFRSSVARLRCTVVRDDLGTERSYLIESDRSSGQYLFDAICYAGAEFAIAVDGYPDKEI